MTKILKKTIQQQKINNNKTIIMKKILLAAVLVAGSITAFAQKFDNVQKFYLLQQLENAKKELDKNLADAKYQNLPETYLWKAKIYGEVASDDKLKATYPNALKESYAAFQKYRQLDPENKLLKADGNYRFISVLYSTAFNTGQKQFTTSQWDSAYNTFVIAEDMGDFVSKNGLTNNKQNIDTLTVVFAGYAAQNAKRVDDALKYYQKFAAEKIGGKDYMEVYRFMLSVYSERKDAANFAKYLALAKELYPNESALWSDFEMDYMVKNLSFNDLLDRYKADDQAGKLTASQYAEYGVMFAGGQREDIAKLDSAKQADIRKLAGEAFRKAYAKSNSGIDAYNAAVMAYNEWSVLDDRYAGYRGTSADLKAKREAVEKQQFVAVDQAIEWMEKAYNQLKAKENRDRNEKTSLNKSVDFLANLYAWKRDKARGKDPKAVDVYDAKYKQYDSEHNKY
jgi:hypothetical protein